MNFRKVLVIDDSPTMRKMVGFALKKMFKIEDVIEAGDGLEALDVLGKEGDSVDLVICDINMPNMNGLEFLKKVRSLDDFKKLPIIMLTTEGKEEDRQRALSMGADGYVVKPFKPDKLKKELEKVLGRRENNG